MFLIGKFGSWLTRGTSPTLQSWQSQPRRGEYNVYSTFQSHEPEFDYLKSLEIEEKINKIRWLRRKNQAHFLLSTNDKTIKLWKVSERDKRIDGYSSRGDVGGLPALRVPTLQPMELLVEATPRRIFANAHTYHINSISVNSDQETYLSADDLRINLWHLEITDQSFSILSRGVVARRGFCFPLLRVESDVPTLVKLVPMYRGRTPVYPWRGFSGWEATKGPCSESTVCFCGMMCVAYGLRKIAVPDVDFKANPLSGDPR